LATESTSPYKNQNLLEITGPFYHHNLTPFSSDRDTFVPRYLPEAPTGDDFSKIQRELTFVKGEMDSGRSEITAF
jgi:hypothetical protein